MTCNSYTNQCKSNIEVQLSQIMFLLPRFSLTAGRFVEVKERALSNLMKCFPFAGGAQSSNAKRHISVFKSFAIAV